MKLIIISDLHFEEKNDWQQIDQITSDMVARIKNKLIENDQVVLIILGDIINKGGKGNNPFKFSEANKFFDKIQNDINNAQFYFIPGNHEIKDDDIIEEFHAFATQYNASYEHFSLEQSVFSYIAEGINLIFADSTLGRKHDANGIIDIVMVKEHMKSNCKNMIFMHHPPCELDGADRNITNSSELIATHANFVFYGHQHGYVKVPDFLQRDTDIHSVGALFKTEDGAKSEFLLLDITDGKINYARRYTYVSKYFHTKLMFPKKDNLLSHEQKLDKPPEPHFFVNRKYIKVENSSNLLCETTMNEEDLLRSENLILLSGDAGIGKTYSLIKMYNIMIKHQDYFPIWLNLRSSNYETIKRHLTYAQYNTIDNKIPILLVDGLDELKSEYLNDFIRDIGSATIGDAEVKIIITIRDNYQLSIDKFKKYRVKSLSQKDIAQIADAQNIDNVENFIEQLKVNDCMKLAQTPFYLFEMINIYKQNNLLPRQSDLFKYMIKIRFKNGDERNPCEHSKSLLGNEYNLLDKLKKLSFFMSATQNYLLENQKYTQIIDPSVREQFQKTGLITKKENYSDVFWEFEHRNFAEFLTADLLSNLDFDSLIGVITYDLQRKKLRPSWVNIVGFIINLRTTEDLKKWLIENAVEELYELQPDSLTESDSFTVFATIFSDLTEKNLYVYMKYDGNKLAKYFQSAQSIDYLSNQLKKSKSDYVVINSLYILMHCYEFYGKEEEISNTVNLHYITPDVKENIVAMAIKLIVALFKTHKTKNICDIISLVKVDTRAEVISETCRLIAETNTSDEFAGYILDILSNTSKMQENSVQKNLVNAVSFFGKTDNILRAIRILSEQKGYIRLFHREELFLTLVEKLCSYEEIKMPDNINDLVDIFVLCANEFRQSEIKVIKQCFRNCDITELALERIISLNLNELDLLYSIESIMDEDLIATLLDLYSRDKLNVDVFKWYARRLPEESIIYFKINNAVKQKEGVALDRDVRINWEKLNKDGVQKYFETLFNKAGFEQLLAELSKYYKENTYCNDLLNESFHKIPADRKDLNCIVTSILHSGLQKTKLVDFITEIDWDSFSINQIIHTIKQNKNIGISHEQKDIIKKYYMKMITIINFEKNTMSDYNIFIAKQMVFLINHFNFEISDEKLLEFLVLPWYVFESSSVSSESETLKYVEQKILNKQKLREKIISNLQQGVFNPYAIQAHIFYCLENNLENAVELSTKFLKDSDKEKSFLQNSAIEYLIAIKGEQYVDDLVAEYMDEQLLKYLSIKLVVHNENLIRILIKKNQESESKLLFLEELINFNVKYALATYIGIAKDSNEVPDKYDDSARVPEITYAIREIKDIELLDYIGELLVLSMSDGFKDTDFFGLYSSTSTAIQNLIQIDPDKVKIKLYEIIKQNSKNVKLQSHCNYYLNNIERQLNVSSDKSWDMDSTLKFIEKIKFNNRYL